MNWDDARVFLAVGREQTLRGAARVLNIDQATVGRRIAALEQALGSVLFLRTSAGYLLTPAGEAAFDAAEKMEASALDLINRTQGLDRSPSGLVRITSTDTFAIDFVIPAIAQLHQHYPGISVILDSSSELANLSRREADIAIRSQKPDNPDLILKRLARWPMGLFASAEYAARNPAPIPGDFFRGHDIVMYRPYLTDTKDPALVGEPITHGRVVAAVNSGMMLRKAVAAGLGIGEIPLYIGLKDNLVRIWPDRERAKPYEVWLVTHRDLRHTARIRAVIDQLISTFLAKTK